MTASGQPADEYAEWDAAYVLGALSPADRRSYELHLDDCVRCRTAVAELAGLPGLLATVPLDSALGAGEPEPVPSQLLPRLVRATRRRHRRTQALVAGALAVAAAAVVVTVISWPSQATNSTQRPNPGTTSVAEPPALELKPLLTVPVTAWVTLHQEAWGTQLDLRCGYNTGTGQKGGVVREYTMFVTARDGSESLAATWSASPGTVANPIGSTALPIADIATIEVRGASGTPLLRLTR